MEILTWPINFLVPNNSKDVSVNTNIKKTEGLKVKVLVGKEANRFEFCFLRFVREMSLNV